MRYLRRTYTVADEARDELIAALWEAGTLGIDEGRGIDEGSSGPPAEAREERRTAAVPRPPLVAWFAGEAAVEVALPAGAAQVDEQWSGDEDWLAAYRAQAQPLAIGERLWVDPREPDAPPLEVPSGRIALRIPARTAFGTGSHASTRLALRLLERLPLAGATLLDVGTGSGILAVAAVALGARRAFGFDVDLAAALLAGQHARLNGVVPGVTCWAGTVDALRGQRRFRLSVAPRSGPQFDVVVANALPHELRAEQRRIAAAVRPGGHLIVSGVPAAEGASVLASWARHAALRVAVELVEEEWVAWVLEEVVNP